MFCDVKRSTMRPFYPSNYEFFPHLNIASYYIAIATDLVTYPI